MVTATAVWSDWVTRASWAATGRVRAASETAPARQADASRARRRRMRMDMQGLPLLVNGDVVTERAGGEQGRTRDSPTISAEVGRMGATPGVTRRKGGHDLEPAAL